MTVGGRWRDPADASAAQSGNIHALSATGRERQAQAPIAKPDDTVGIHGADQNKLLRPALLPGEIDLAGAAHSQPSHRSARPGRW